MAVDLRLKTPRRKNDLLADALAAPDTALQQALEAFNAAAEGVRVGMCQPQDGQADWYPFARLAEEPFGYEVIRRIAEMTRATGQAPGSYTLRYALYTPLMLAGYLYASQRRVLSLRDNLLTANREWLNHVHVLAPAFTVLPSDRLAGRPGCATAANESRLADALVDEMKALAGPLIESWSAQKLVARANAWACAIDSLAYGFQLAGRHRIGLDAAWELWDAVIAGRIFPVRRRPRRFRFSCDGEQDELLIRSGCCLWFTQPAAKNGPMRYCSSCYIETDERRLEQITANRRKQNANA